MIFIFSYRFFITTNNYNIMKKKIAFLSLIAVFIAATSLTAQTTPTAKTTKLKESTEVNTEKKVVKSDAKCCAKPDSKCCTKTNAKACCKNMTPADKAKYEARCKNMTPEEEAKCCKSNQAGTKACVKNSVSKQKARVN